MKRFRLREQAGADPQTYALGLKEVWEVRAVPRSSHAVMLISTLGLSLMLAPSTSGDSVIACMI